MRNASKQGLARHGVCDRKPGSSPARAMPSFWTSLRAKNKQGTGQARLAETGSARARSRYPYTSFNKRYPAAKNIDGGTRSKPGIANQELREVYRARCACWANCLKDHRGTPRYSTAPDAEYGTDCGHRGTCFVLCRHRRGRGDDSQPEPQTARRPRSYRADKLCLTSQRPPDRAAIESLTR